MKEKRYLCDFVFGELDKRTERIVILIVILSFLGITAIVSLICYNIGLTTYKDELNAYPASAYEHLDEIANNVIQEGVGIDLLAIPDDVVSYEITRKDNEIIFKYYLDNNKGMQLASSANMTIKLSNDFNIISKSPNYSSKESYVKYIKLAIGFRSELISIFAYLLFLLIILMSSLISEARKRKDLMNGIKSEVRKQKNLS